MEPSKNPDSPASIFDRKWNEESPAESIVETYQSMSVTAIIAFIFALLGQSVYINFAFVFLPIIGIVFALISAYTIRKSEGTVFGLAFAKFSLFLCIVPIVAAGIIWPYYNYTLIRQADRFAKMWFNAVLENDIPKVVDFRVPYWERPRHETSDAWWKARYDDQTAHQEIHHILEQPLMRTLIALGDKAEVSYVRTLSMQRDDYRQYLTLLYAVTYPKDDGSMESFYLAINLEQSYNEKTKALGWSISGIPEKIYTQTEKQDSGNPE